MEGDIKMDFDKLVATATEINYKMSALFSMLVEFELFLGKPFVNVHHFGTFQLEA